MLPTFVKHPDGSVFINPSKRYVPSYWLTTNPNRVVAIGAGATTAPQLLPVDSQGHFEIFYAMCERDAACTIRIFDPGRSTELMNREVHIDTITSGVSGNASLRPFIWPESYFLNVEDAGRALTVQFRDLSGVGGNIRYALCGRRFYTKESPPDVYEKMFQYFGRKERTNVYFLTTDVATQIGAGVGTELVATARVTDEADFEMFKITSVHDGPYEFMLRNRSNGRALMSDFIHVDLGTGTAEFPFILPEPWLVERNYQVEIVFRNLQAGANNVFFTMTGRRLYYAQ